MSVVNVMVMVLMGGLVTVMVMLKIVGVIVMARLL
jgi:hypothetical protein